MEPACLTVRIDGVEHRFPAGLTVLEALGRVGIAVPTLCHDPRLQPIGACWLCAVAISAGPGQPAHDRPACHEPLVDGAWIDTGGERLRDFRRGLLAELASHVEAGEAERFPDKPLHRLLRAHGVAPAGGASDPATVDDSHPYLRVDLGRCIGCLACVRACDELQGESVWHVFGRGDRTRVGTEGGVPLAESACVGCGACVAVCPSAALTDASAWREPAPTAWTRTTCAYCGVGCELEVGTAADRIVATRPVIDAPSNRGHLCAKGRYAQAYVDAPDRITAPLLRQDGSWQAVGWDAAIGHAADGLARIRARHGPDAIGVLGSSRATNEENFLTQKFARLVLGTNNVDCCARVCHAPSAAALKRVLGTGAATSSYDDIERAGMILVVGCNPLENHPVVGARIRRRARRGARLVVIDPRRTALAAIADLHLAPRPGTNLPLFAALAHVLIAERLVDPDFIAARVDGVAAFEEHVAAWPPERAAGLCGVAAEDIRRAARLYGGTRPALCFHGLGVTEHLQGTDGVTALINLALLTGNLGRPGAGVNPLRGQNNVQGAAVMGCEPDTLTGSVPLAAARERFAAAWKAPLPTTPGLNLLQMVDAARDGRLKALYVIGYDILASLAHRSATAAALARLELVIVQDLFLTDTARELGHLFLPATSHFEKDGSFMNSERRIQRVRRALSPRGAARSDGEILQALATRLGHGTAFAEVSAEAVWDEVRGLWPAVAGIDYARIAEHGLQWPCRDAQDPGTAFLHAERFAHGPRATLACIDYTPTLEQVDAAFPFLLSTGRTLQQFNVGTMSGRTAQNRLRPTDTLDMHPDDAARLGVVDGDELRVQSRHGMATLPLRVTAVVQPGQLFATFHDPARRLNELTGPVRDGVTSAPEYKVVAVRVERA